MLTGQDLEKITELIRFNNQEIFNYIDEKVKDLVTRKEFNQLQDQVAKIQKTLDTEYVFMQKGIEQSREGIKVLQSKI
jgi:regulator of sigma D